MPKHNFFFGKVIEIDDGPLAFVIGTRVESDDHVFVFLFPSVYSGSNSQRSTVSMFTYHCEWSFMSAVTVMFVNVKFKIVKV